MKSGFPVYEPGGAGEVQDGEESAADHHGAAAASDPNEAAAASDPDEAAAARDHHGAAATSDPDEPAATATIQQPSPHPDLRAAFDRVLDHWRQRGIESDRSAFAELNERLARVTDRVSAAYQDRTLDWGDDDGVVLERRLLELLRRELVGIWAGEDTAVPEPDVMARMLDALERVQDDLSPRWDDEFGVMLQGPSGLELAVEVAHDFRSPLSSVLFLADTLRSGGSGKLNDLQRRQMDLVYSAALSMVSMAGDVVDLGRSGNALTEREPTRFSVAEVMRSVESMVEPMVQAKGLSLIVHSPEGDHRLGYPEALRRVLLNLTTNAVKFTSEGFIELSGRTRGHSRVLFSVRDTGPGIREAAREDLYRPFRPFRGHAGFHFSGTGLGLTIARKMVTAMEGELRYETQRNLGTRFYFAVPLHPVEPL